MLGFYGGSLKRAINELYSPAEDSMQFEKQFFGQISNELRFNPLNPENWYRISATDCSQRKVIGLTYFDQADLK